MKYLKDGWLILVLALVFASGLTAVQSALAPRIAQNLKDKTYSRIPMLMLGEEEVEGMTVEPAVEGSPLIAYRVSLDGEVIGYVLEGSGGGYADRIKTLVGLSADGSTITGVSVLKQMETPNLGSKITGDWADQYAGKAVSPSLKAVAGSTGGLASHQLDAITGATISSVCLTDIVNDTVAAFLVAQPSLEWETPAADEDDVSGKSDAANEDDASSKEEI